MSEQRAILFLATVSSQLSHQQYPATHSINALCERINSYLAKKLPPHLHPLLIRLRAFCVRHMLQLEQRLRMNPTFKLLLRTRIIPPSLAFMAATASTIYIARYLYVNSLDLLTNIVGVAYPAYQSILAIEYGDSLLNNSSTETATTDDSVIRQRSNLDKKQWLMYWAIYGVLTTADHWAGSILQFFPIYRLAKIGVLMWAQHSKYNGATWLYDTFVKPLLPPPSTYLPQQPLQQKERREEEKEVIASTSPPFTSMVMPSVWASTNNLTSTPNESQRIHSTE